MVKKLSPVLAIVIEALIRAVFVPTAQAQDIGCDDIEFGASALEEFPSVAQSCHSVVERDDDRLYVRLVADVVRVTRDGTIVVDLKGPDGSRVRHEFHPPAGFQASINGRPTPPRKLRRGQEIRFYLPADRWQVRP